MELCEKIEPFKVSFRVLHVCERFYVSSGTAGKGGGGSSLSARLRSNPVVVLARLSLLTGSVRRI